MSSSLRSSCSGVDGVSIGSNDLTQLILGIDRDSSKLASTFDERNEAVMMAIERIVRGCRQAVLPARYAGRHRRFTRNLPRNSSNGITSVSVSPDMIDITREIIAKRSRD